MTQIKKKIKTLKQSGSNFISDTIGTLENSLNKSNFIKKYFWLIPVLWHLVLVPFIHSIPNNDYWGHFVIPIVGSSDLGTFMRGFLSFSNEHLIIVSNILNYLNYLLTGGDNRGLYYINIVINLTSVVFLAKLIREGKFFIKKIRIWIILIVSLFFFSLAPAHNWILSMSGISWFTSNMFLIITLYFLFKFLNFGKPKYGLLLIFFSIIASITYSTGIMVYGVVAIFLVAYVFFFKKKWKFTLLYVLISGSFYLIWFKFLYNKPDIHPNLQLNLVYLVKYAVAYLGNPFTKNKYVAFGYGLVGLAMLLCITIFILFRTYKNRDKEFFVESFVWLLMPFFSVINSLATAVARSNFGVKTALSSRYINISLLFWLGLILAGTYILSKVEFSCDRLVKRLAVVIVIFAIIMPMYILGIKDYVFYFEKFSSTNEALMDLTFELEMNDENLTKKFFGLRDTYYLDGVDNLDTHVPFKSSVVPGYEYNDKILDEDITDEARIDFDVNESYEIENSEGWSKISGKMNTSGCAGYVVLTDTNNEVIGAAIFERDRFGRRMDNNGCCSWVGYLKLEKNDKIIRIYRRTEKEEYEEIGDYRVL